MTFDELEFKERPMFGEGDTRNGVQCIVFFPNGYGASIIKGPGTYGYEQGLYELAVLKGDADSADLCYTTPITGDVIGNLGEAAVCRAITRIEKLPNVGGRNG